METSICASNRIDRLVAMRRRRSRISGDVPFHIFWILSTGISRGRRPVVISADKTQAIETEGGELKQAEKESEGVNPAPSPSHRPREAREN